jgi:hypoxanthine phosphoribosyltransferase
MAKDKLWLTWQDIEDLTERLAQQIQNANFKPDIIVAVPRGGFIPARILADIFDVKNLISFPEGLLPDDRVGPHKILVVDEICDTGKTVIQIQRVRPSWKIATLHTRSTAPVRPNFPGYLLEGSEWIVYPWEKCEEISQSSQLKSSMNESKDRGLL